MPNIPIIEQSVGAAFTPNSAKATGDTFGANIGRAVSAAGDAVGKIADDLEKQNEELKAKREQDEWLALQADIYEQVERANDDLIQFGESTPDKTGFRDQFRGRIDASKNQFFTERQGISERNRARAELLYAQRIDLPFGTKAAGIEAEFRSAKPIADAERALKGRYNTLFADPTPERLELMLGDAPVEIGSMLPQLDDVQRGKLLDGDRSKLYDAYIRGQINVADSIADLQAVQEQLLAGGEKNRFALGMDDVDYQRALATIEKRIEGSKGANNKAANRRAKDEIARLRQGADPSLSNEELIAGVPDDDPDLASRLIAERDDAQQIGQLSTSIFGMSPDEIAGLIEQQREVVASPDSYSAAEEQLLGQMLTLAEKRQAALDKDPAAFTARYSPEVQKRAETMALYPGDAEATQRYADVLVAEQTRLGVADRNIRLLPNEQRASLAASLSGEVEGESPQQRYERIQELRTVWGDNWDRVYRELAPDLPDSVLIAADMPHDFQEEAASQLLQLPGKWTDIIGEVEQSDKDQLREATQESLESVRDVYLQHVEGSDHYTKLQGQVRKLAAHYVNNGMDIDEAAKRATSQVTGAYEYEGSYAVPAVRDTVAIRSGAAKFKDEGRIITNFQLPEGMPADEYAEIIQERGVWINTPHNDGLYLKAPKGKSATGLAIVRNPDGTPFMLRWADLEAMGYQVPDTRIPITTSRGTRRQ